MSEALRLSSAPLTNFKKIKCSINQYWVSCSSCLMQALLLENLHYYRSARRSAITHRRKWYCKGFKKKHSGIMHTDVWNVTPHATYLEAMLLKRGKHAHKENTAGIRSMMCFIASWSTCVIYKTCQTCCWNVCNYKKFRSHCMCDRTCWWDALWHLHNFCGSKARDQEIWRSSISQATICCKCYKVLATGQPVTMPGTHKLASKLPAKAVQKITFTEWMPH